LSKINAWTLFIVIILALPVKDRWKKLQLVILAGLTCFLIARSITNIFIGTGIVILLFACIIGLFILKKKVIVRKISITSFITFFIGSIALGGFWIIDRINKSSGFLDELINLYFRVFNSIILEYNGSTTYSLDINLEYMQGVNFWSASLFFLIGTAFCVPWIVPKVLGLIRGIEISPIIIWVLVFFMIWMAYYFQGSVRYLSPIYIPMAVLIVHGFHSMLQYFDVPLKSKLPRAVLLFFGCINFYYLISLDFALLGENTQELVGMAYNRSAFSYYSQPEIGLIQILMFILIWLGLMVFVGGNSAKVQSWVQRIFPNRHISLSHRFFRPVTSGLTVFFISLVILIPIATQGYVWIQSSGDLETFQGTMEYEYNEDYQSIAEIIIQQGSVTGAVLTVRMPGLQVFTQHPALDFYYQSSLLGKQFFESQNLSHLVNVLKDPIQHLMSIRRIFGRNRPFSGHLITLPSLKC
ncbi:MAG: hypothetical protein ACXACR_17715, partial [Candidatus Hodarchaeales archaeon]